MTGRSRKKTKEQASASEFVTVAFAEDMELAQQYKKLLNDDNIPAAIKSGSDSASNFPGIAVLVPEDHLDAAHVLIESQGTYNDFYDMVFHDQDESFNDDFDEDLFDDEF
jgi:hypothetical protein